MGDSSRAVVASEDAKAGRDNSDLDTSQEHENGRDESWQADPSKGAVSNDTYHRQSHKFTEQQHRTGLRKSEEHASWRDVYAACHVGVGVDV